MHFPISGIMEILIESARGIRHLIATRGPLSHIRPMCRREVRAPR